MQADFNYMVSFNNGRVICLIFVFEPTYSH